MRHINRKLQALHAIHEKLKKPYFKSILYKLYHEIWLKGKLTHPCSAQIIHHYECDNISHAFKVFNNEKN